MKPDIRIGWATIGFLVAISIAMVISARLAHADQPTLTDRIAAVIPSLVSSKEENVDAREFAEAVASVPKVNREWAALLLTIATHESSLRARIARSEYRSKKEGDGGRAFGLFQAHKNSLNADVWGSTDIRVQTIEAARALRSAFYQCNGRQPPRADWVARTINAYAGRRCDAQWVGLDRRVATFNRVVRRL